MPSSVLVADVRQQGHETGPFDGLRYGPLAHGGAAALAAANQLALAAGEFPQQLQVLVIDIHRTGALAIDKHRILLLAAGTDLGSFLSHRTTIQEYWVCKYASPLGAGWSTIGFTSSQIRREAL